MLHNFSSNSTPSTSLSHSDKKTILFVIESLVLGGAERLVVEMANRFNRDHWNIHLVCLSTPGEFADNVADDVHFHSLGKKLGFDAFLSKPIDATVLFATIAKFFPDEISCGGKAETTTKILLNQANP